MQKHFVISAFATVLVALSPLYLGLGTCGVQLEPGGVYEEDPVLFRIEDGTVKAKKTFDELVKYEYENRELLARWPEVKEAVDEIRRNAPTWFAAANDARDEYVDAKEALAAAKELSAQQAAAAQLDAKAAAINERLNIINAAVDIATRLLIQYQQRTASP